MSFPWKNEHMEIFLEAYRYYECLWNNKPENYHKINVRENAYKSLHTEMNLPQLRVNDIKSKIKTIRTRYCSELAKIRKFERSGTGSNDVYVPRLFWFKQADAFLRDVCTPKESSTNMQGSLNSTKQHSKSTLSKSIQEMEDSGENLNLEFQTEESRYSENVTLELETPNQTNTPITTSSSCENKRKVLKSRESKRGASSSMESIHGAIEKLSKISDATKKQNEVHEFDAFCNSLAIQLKKMPLQQALICQEKLQGVMTQHRLSLISAENPASPIYNMYLSTPSPASTFSDQASQGFYSHNQSSCNDNSSCQETATNVLSQAISSISGFNIK